jgi:hypothetical protein
METSLALWPLAGARGLPGTVRAEFLNVYGRFGRSLVVLLGTMLPLTVAAAEPEFTYTTWISGPTFEFCSSLTSVTIPKGVINLSPTTFLRCTNLTALTVDAGNPMYSSVDGVLFNKAGTTLIRYPGGKTGPYMLPKGVTTIGDGAFWGCPTLQTITIPKTVTNIQGGALVDCSRLAEVYFEGNAPALASLAFGADRTATIYHLPGTTGWSSTFSDFLTAPWKPRMQASEASFGVLSNGFGFNLTWARDKVVVVQATPDLITPAWSSVATNTLPDGSFNFSDPQWGSYPNRFYRLRAP